MRIELIIFDLDGTLVDSIVDITNTLNYATEPYDIDRLTVEKATGMVGEGLTRLIEKLLGEERAEILPDVLERFVSYYSDHLTDFTAPYPGVRDTLERLGSYKKAVISNKRELLSKKLLQSLELDGYFDLILGGDSVETKKPSPEPVLKVIDMLRSTPEETVIVGDSNYDIEAGKAAGIATIAVSYGYRDVSLLQDADFIIDDIRDLEPKLNAL